MRWGFDEFHDFTYLESGFSFPYNNFRMANMDSNHFWMFFHLLGFGLIVTLLVAGWLLHKQYTAAADFKTKAVVLISARSIGLISPVAILVLLITGIGNMHTLGLGLFDEWWLSVKVLLFVIAAANGIRFGIQSKKRGMLLGQLAQGTAEPGSESKLVKMDKGTLVFFVVQAILFTAILVLAVWKPGRYAF